MSFAGRACNTGILTVRPLPPRIPSLAASRVNIARSGGHGGAPPASRTAFTIVLLRIVETPRRAGCARIFATARELSGMAWDAGSRVARRRERAGITRSGVKVSLRRRARRRAVKAGVAFRAVAQLEIPRAAAVLSRRAEAGRGAGASCRAEGSRVALSVAEGLAPFHGVLSTAAAGAAPLPRVHVLPPGPVSCSWPGPEPGSQPFHAAANAIPAATASMETASMETASMETASMERPPAWSPRA